ncbi:restriction endonuclease [bacterium]|nr:restriction endonuclease [bacterium]
MDYNKFCGILNKHIFEGEKRDLLKKLAERPERFIGLFRPTKPGAKILQHLLQSHEIRFGDAIEELITEIIADLGYRNLPKTIRDSNDEILSLDQYFTNDSRYYFIEQKVRDDHDSTKKRGQINNFKKKLEVLHNLHRNNLVGIMYFIDPDLTKNKNFYVEKLGDFSEFYGVELRLFYGKELFEYFDKPQVWDNIIQWLTRWKNELPDLPEINFDEDPEESFEEIRELEIRHWRKILENDTLWSEEIMQVLFRTGETLRLVSNYFREQHSTPYRSLEKLLREKLSKYYENR